MTGIPKQIMIKIRIHFGISETKLTSSCYLYSTTESMFISHYVKKIKKTNELFESFHKKTSSTIFYPTINNTDEVQNNKNIQTIRECLGL